MPNNPRPAQGDARRVMFQSTPIAPASPVTWWDSDESLAPTIYPSDHGGSPPPQNTEADDGSEGGDEDGDPEEEDGEEGYEEAEDGDQEDAASTTSSELYDRDADPEAYASRLDELAGVLEMGQVESKAMKWGPAMGKQRDVPKISMSDLKELIDHHLSSTEWQYNPPVDLFPPLPGRLGAFGGADPVGSMLPIGLEEGIHPIRVLGVDVLGHGIGADDVERESAGDL